MHEELYSQWTSFEQITVLMIVLLNWVTPVLSRGVTWWINF